MRIRQALFPVLRPDAREVSVDWWDTVAVPKWIVPFFADLAADGRFDAATIANEYPGAYCGFPTEREKMSNRMAKFKARMGPARTIQSSV
jgi:hypothetical protein